MNKLLSFGFLALLLLLPSVLAINFDTGVSAADQATFDNILAPVMKTCLSTPSKLNWSSNWQKNNKKSPPFKNNLRFKRKKWKTKIKESATAF